MPSCSPSSQWGFGVKSKLRLFAPGLHGDVVLFGLADGDFVAGEIGDAGEREAHLLVERGGRLVEFVELVLERTRLVHHGGGIFAFPLECGDLLTELVAAGFQLF